MCFTLIRAALLADRIYRRQQAKEANAAAQQQQQQYQYANPAAPYTAEATTGVITTEKPYQPQTTVSQVA
jgi:type II secretory pathway pseudopilin PulG